MQNQSKPSRLAALFRESVILSFFMRAANFLYDSALHSLFGCLLTSGNADRCSAKGSFFCNLFHLKRYSIRNRLLLPSMRFFNKAIDRSVLLTLLRRFLSYLLTLPVRFWGTILFAYGSFTVASDLILHYALSLPTQTANDVLTGGLIALVTFPLLFASTPLIHALADSGLMHFLLSTVMGLRLNVPSLPKHSRGKSSVALIIGIVLGFLTATIPFLHLLVILISVILAVLILISPEIGVLFIFGALPFLPTMRLLILILLTGFSFCIKLAQGKRALSFEPIDFAVLGLLAFFFLGGFFSLAPSDSLPPALLMTCLIGGYFLIIAAVNNTSLAKRCIGVLLFSACSESLIGICEALFGNPSTIWQDMTLFSSISGRIVGTLENPNVLGEYLILTIPFLFALYGQQKKNLTRLGAFLMIAISMTALALTWSRGAWLGILAALFLYALLRSRKFLPLFFTSLPFLPLLTLIIPDAILHRLFSIGNLADTSTAYRINVWRGCLRLAGDHLLGGIGTGVNTFMKVYPSYSLPGIEAAPHSHNLYLQILLEHGLLALLLFLVILLLFSRKCIRYLSTPPESFESPLHPYTAAGMCAILGYLIQGMTEYVWYNYRIFGFFWMLLALVSAFSRCSERERIRPELENEPSAPCL